MLGASLLQVMQGGSFAAAAGGPEVTHSQYTATAFGANRTVTLSHVPDSGKSLLLLVDVSGDPGAWNITDNQGNTYTQDFVDLSIAFRYAFRCHNITNAPTTLQFTNPNSVIIKVVVFEVKGLAAAAPSVAGGQASGSNVATLTRSHTPAAANELVVGWLVAGADRTTTSDVLPAGVLNAPAIGATGTIHGFAAVVPTVVATNFKQTFSESTASPRLLTMGYAAA